MVRIVPLRKLCWHILTPSSIITTIISCALSMSQNTILQGPRGQWSGLFSSKAPVQQADRNKDNLKIHNVSKSEYQTVETMDPKEMWISPGISLILWAGAHILHGLWSTPYPNLFLKHDHRDQISYWLYIPELGCCEESLSLHIPVHMLVERLFLRDRYLPCWWSGIIFVWQNF